MRGNKSAVFCLLVGIAVFSRANAVLADEPPEFLKKITDNGPPGPKFGKGYLARLYALGFDGLHASIHPIYLEEKHPELRGANGVSIIYSAHDKDIIAAFGLLYRVTSVKEKERTIEWIPPKEAPAGVTAHADSIFVPFEKDDHCVAKFRGSSIRFLGVAENERGKKENMRGNLALKVHSTLEKRGATSEAIVKAGDILLVNEKGHKVRAIVPRDEKTRVFGWVELDAKPIPQADLVRDKTAFVEPEIKAKEPPVYQKIKIGEDFRHGPAYPLKGSSGVIEVQLSFPSYTIQYPHLVAGDVVAMFGCLYRVRNPSVKGMLEWVSDEAAPPGLAPQAGSMFVPLQQKGDGGIIILDAVRPGASLRFLGPEKKANEKAILARMVSGRADRELAPTSWEFVVQAGDFLLVKGKGYKVRAIVPADAKTRVRGWVELDANGIPEADLIRDKKAFVRPMAKKAEKAN